MEKRKGALTEEERKAADKIRRDVESHHVLLAPAGQDTRNLIDMRIGPRFSGPP